VSQPDWKQILVDATTRISDVAMREKAAALMERATELSVQKLAGMDVDADLAMVAASAASLTSAQAAIAASAVEQAVWARMRSVIWTTIFGLGLP